jgi:PAB1-binding protein PBP1
LKFNICSQKNTSWNQFEINQKLFGVTTSYKEEIYTTVVDKTAPDFREKEKMAAKIALEIEKVIFLLTDQ